MFFENIFLNQQPMINQFKQERNCFCHLIVKNYMCNILYKFLIQFEKHMDVRNQRANTPADFTVLSEAAT